MRYAASTSVSVEKSQAELRATVQRYGAASFGILVVKAKLEAVAAGISTFEDEFLAFVVLPGGGTVGRWLRPQLDNVYKTGKLPPLLGAGGAP